MPGTADELLLDRGPQAARDALRAVREIRMFDGRATAGIVALRSVEVTGLTLALGALSDGSALAGRWLWVALGFALVLGASESPLGRIAGGEPSTRTAAPLGW